MALDDRHSRSADTVRRRPQPPTAGAVLEKVSRLTGDELLTCGRPLRHAWEQARDAWPLADPHTARCPYCRDAAAGLSALDEATRALRAQEPPHAQTLIDRVMDIVRAEVRLGRLLPLDDPVRDLFIAETAAAKVLRRAADMVTGARAASCRLTPADADTGVHVAMTLAANLGRPLTETADRVRSQVRKAAAQSLGLTVTAIDLEVIDVLDPAFESSGTTDAERDRQEGTP
ncbi:Asp23/Gls24 family envelope stress response protein [Streptomyces sp. F001]|uniref:Asp23/Gls24 family envelope stress response protein n=1 Tax=Streptomyces sp. F001 TaxID=1510026 RepID=UPI00101E2377|nr:Asp23/Gls24 family envelope stress response protein [Streptomyces sp. F001]RZB13313.1 Asp23/Gls24 family envelope stress response protein [Streptomyces sp. F001]